LIPDGADAFLPRGRDVGVQPQGVDAGVVFFQISPEQADNVAGHGIHGGVVQLCGSFGEVVHQQVANGAAGDVVAINELGWAQLPRQQDRLEPLRSVRSEDAGLRE